MLAQQRPFEGEKKFTIPEFVVQGRRPPLPADCPPPLRLLVNSCWAPNPERRPNFASISQILASLLPSSVAISSASSFPSYSTSGSASSSSASSFGSSSSTTTTSFGSGSGTAASSLSSVFSASPGSSLLNGSGVAQDAGGTSALTEQLRSAISFSSSSSSSSSSSPSSGNGDCSPGSTPSDIVSPSHSSPSSAVSTPLSSSPVSSWTARKGTPTGIKKTKSPQSSM